MRLASLQQALVRLWGVLHKPVQPVQRTPIQNFVEELNRTYRLKQGRKGHSHVGPYSVLDRRDSLQKFLCYFPERLPGGSRVILNGNSAEYVIRCTF